MFNYSQVNNFEYGCASRGACSVSPSVYALKAVMMVLLAQNAYLLSKLSTFNREYSLELLEIISNIDTSNDYSDSQILNIFSKQYANYLNLRRIFSEKQNQKRIPRDRIKLKPEFTLSDIIQKGQSIITNIRKSISSDEKYMRDIFLNMLKSSAVNCLMLYEFEQADEQAHKIVNTLAYVFNRYPGISHLKEAVKSLAKINSSVLNRISECYFKKFGIFQKTIVSCSTKKNKAVLISGDNIPEIKNLLEALSETDIDVYTNGNMLIAHSFSELSKYKNLKGHFGNSQETMMLDFATFPGAIMLTKRSFQNIDYLYRGRLFSSDAILPKGIKKINKDFSELIMSSDSARGFVKGQKRKDITVGYDIDEFEKKVIDISEKLKSKTYKNLIIIGFGVNTNEEASYFKTFYKGIIEDNFVISFSHYTNSKNVLNINLANNYALLNKFLQITFKHINIDSKNLYFILPKCDGCALSEIVALRERGGQNISIAKCPPTAINPSVLNLFVKTFGISFITEPEIDIKKIT